jgi:hypothetical protein
MDDATAFKGFEALGDHAIRVVGSGIEIFGVLIIVTGIAWSNDGRCPGRILMSTRSVSVDRSCLASRFW